MTIEGEACNEPRNKKKDKFKRNKGFPYNRIGIREKAKLYGSVTKKEISTKE